MTPIPALKLANANIGDDVMDAVVDRLLPRLSPLDGLPYGQCVECGRHAEVYAGGVCERCEEAKREAASVEDPYDNVDCNAEMQRRAV